MMKALIIGGAGYIGSHVNLFFNKRGIDTVVLDDLSNGSECAVVAGKFIKGSFADRELVLNILNENQFDAVLHFGSRTSISQSVRQPSLFYRNNVANLQTLLDCCVEAGVKTFIFSSSCTVFGEPKYLPMDESHPFSPVNPDGNTRLIGEKLLADYERAYGMHYCILRSFTVSGCDGAIVFDRGIDPETHYLPLLIQYIKSGFNIDIRAGGCLTKDGSCVRDFTHVNDIAEGFYYAARNVIRNGKSNVFNLGTGVGTSILQLVAEVEKATGKTADFKLLERSNYFSSEQVSDSRKAKEILGWIPQHSSIGKLIEDSYLPDNIVVPIVRETDLINTPVSVVERTDR